MYTKKFKDNIYNYSVFADIKGDCFILSSADKTILDKAICKFEKLDNDYSELHIEKDIIEFEDEIINPFKDDVLKNIDIECITDEVNIFEKYYKTQIDKFNDNLKKFEILKNSFNGIKTLTENQTRDVVIWLNSNEFVDYVNENLEENDKIKTLDEAKNKGYEIEIVDNSVIEFVG